jgi:8-oxo-dGTP pyrophosphatase MutT (NUDIX family)
MDVIRANEPFPRSVTRAIYLAGPAARGASWRGEALRILAERGYDGAVLVPEPSDAAAALPSDERRAWEREGLRRADAILFWFPAQPDAASALVDHVDLGAWLRSGKVVLGAAGDPTRADLKQLGAEAKLDPAPTLAAAVEGAIARAGAGAARVLGECDVPAEIFTTPAFQAWYRAQRAAGNTLAGASVEWVFRVGRDRRVLFFAVQADVFVTAEGRHKKNEVVLSRPDIASVVLFHRAAAPGETRVVLVREFRSPAITSDGCVHECPGGSSFAEPFDMARVALDEVREEVGLRLEASRVRPVGVRQLAATTSAHRAHVFACELTAAEIDALAAAPGAVHGADADERTTLELWTVDELSRRPDVDWSTLGMIMAALGARA